MGRREMEEEVEPKAKLVKEICFISTAFASCAHLCSNARKKVFIDWYLILKVDEDSGLDVIRRRYKQLALQLHPDKNKHPKAEVAFKLISEAYACLSDKARRKSFNGERKSNFCKDCYLNWQSHHHQYINDTKISSNKNNNNDTTTTNNNNNSDNNNTKPRRQSPIKRARRYHILQKLKQVQNRFTEECRVIEACLKATRPSLNTTGRESPLFDPHDSIRFPNYSYRRRTAETMTMSPRHCFFQPDAAWGQVPCESPVYQIRSDCWTRTPKSQFSEV